MKVYQRELDSNSPDTPEDSLHKLLAHIPNASKVLDIGCGTGTLGGRLVTDKNCDVTGVDINPDSIVIAAQKLTQAMCADISKTSLSKTLNEQFDIIVLADVLEHISEPDKLLHDCHKLLNANGKLLVSIPNAAYIGAILSLYYDEWEYGEEGILDTTHVRFYTRNSILKLLENNGYQAQIIDYVAKDLTETEFTQRADSLNPAVFDWLTTKADAVAYQFIINASKPTAKQVQHATPPAVHFQHIVKLYWQSTNEAEFNADYYQLQRGRMGQSNQLRFSLNVSKLAKLRLDFADRKSTYLIDKIEVYDADSLLHSIDAEDAIQPFNCRGKDANLPTRFIAEADAHLVAELGTPINGEKLSVVVSMQAPISDDNLAFLDSSVDTNTDKAALTAQNDALNNKLSELSAQIAALKQQIQQNKASYDMLCDQLNGLKNSTSWRLTAPLRKLTNLLNRKH